MGRRATDRPSRSQPGHEGHGHAPGALEGHRTARHAATTHSTNGSSPAADGAAHAHSHGVDGAERRGDPHRAVATSPAVGVFQPRRESGPGSRVRAGDRLGAVDMLGIAQEVVAPADGVVTGVLVEAGDAVEYGQELVVLELMTQAGST
jgi:biotin carboxyl carrier protein